MPPKLVHIQVSCLDNLVKPEFYASKGKESQVRPIVPLALADRTTAMSELPLHSETSPADHEEDIMLSQLLNHLLCKAGSMKHMY